MTWREPAAHGPSERTNHPRPGGQAVTLSNRVEELFERHNQRLYRLAVRMTSDPEAARDLVQDAFLRMARSSRRLPPGEPAGEAWAVRTLVNLCRDRYRRRKVRQGAAWKLEEPGAVASSEAAVVARRTLESAMTVLSPRRRAILVLCELEERPAAEVAAVLGLAAATVRWHLAAARRQLGKELQALEKGTGS